jgi:aldose 1-epimerase
MKLGFCFAAFVIGCLCAVLIRTNDSSADAHKTEDIALTVPNSAGDANNDKVGESDSAQLKIAKELFGELEDGRPVSKFICTNVNGLSFEIIEYGATVIAVNAPDRSGKFQNIALSCEGLEGYQACTSYFGASVGRYCNRIANSTFSLDGKTFQLSANDGANHLHGGQVGFDRRLWATEEIVDADAVGVRMTLVSEDGDQGFPGNCTVSVTYLLNNDDELSIEFVAESDAATPINLTNHTYWNLAGAGDSPIYDHVLNIQADQILEFDDQNLPTGKLVDVLGTRYDFTSPRSIYNSAATDSGDSRTDDPAEGFAGYDHNFCLRSQSGNLAAAARVYSPKSGRQLEIKTTEPGLQFYTGNFLDGLPGSGGFEKHTGFCLETQHYPDSPNHPEFPSTILRPGSQFKKTTVISFSVVD